MFSVARLDPALSTGLPVAGGLQGEEFGVSVAAGDEIVVRSEFDELAVVEDVDGVGVADVGESVGDQVGGRAALAIADGLEQRVFCSWVEGG
jgi:hypothetical protein